MLVGSMGSYLKGSATCSILPGRPFRRLPALLSVSQLESEQSFLFLIAWRIDRPLRLFQSRLRRKEAGNAKFLRSIKKIPMLRSQRAEESETAASEEAVGEEEDDGYTVNSKVFAK